MVASQMFPCYKVFPAEISLCSVSSSAPPKTMSKCSLRAGAESSRSLQAAGARRWRAGVGVSHSYPPALWRCWHCKGPARRLFLRCAGVTTAPSPTLTPTLITACQTALRCLAHISVQLPAVASGPGCPRGMHGIRQPSPSTAGGQPVPGTGTGELSVGTGRCRAFPLPCPASRSLEPRGRERMGAGSAASPTPHTHKRQWVHNHLPSSSFSSSTSPNSQCCSGADEQARSQQDSPGAPGRSEAMN